MEVSEEKPQDDISADLAKAFDEAEQGAPVESPVLEAPPEKPVETPSEGSERVRAPDGKFAKAEAAETPATPAPIDELKADDAWPAEVKAAWEKTPPEARKFIRDAYKGIQDERNTFTPDRDLAKSIKETAAPYMAMIQSEGSDLPKAVGNLLQTAYLLRHAPADQKRAALLGIAQKFGVDLGGVSGGEGVEQPLSALTPELQAFQRQLQALQATVTNQTQTLTQTQEAQQRAQFHTLFTEFENDRQNFPHFVQVYEEMTSQVASIIQRNPGLDHRSVLKKAYDNAIWLNPNTRAELQKQTPAQPQLNEKTAIAAKAAVRGAPQGAAPTKPQTKVHDDPRDDLAHLWSQFESGAA